MLMRDACPESLQPKGVPTAGLELWASKNLDLLWLPLCDNWHCPSLHEVEPAPDRLTTSPCMGVRWFWRVDAAFVAWVGRAISRADRAKAELPHDTLSGFQTIRSYLEETQPGSLATLPLPGELPGKELITQAAVFAKFGLGPRWEGWERLVNDAPPGPTTTVSREPAVVKPSAKRQPSNQDVKPKLF